jgi:DNA-binding MarR family transcriptional regulator
MAKEKKFKYEWMDLWRTDFGPESPKSRLVLYALADFMNAEGKNCWPSQKTLSERTRLSERTIVRHIKALVKEGWIEKTTKGYNNRQHRLNQYKARIPDYVSKKLKTQTTGKGVRYVDADPPN